MATRDIPFKTARATSTLPVDVEHGQASSAFTPDDTPSKAATPTRRPSLEIDDTPQRYAQWPVASQWWTRIAERTPAPVARCGGKVVDWVKGPDPPRIYHVTPFFERWQTLPVRLLARLPRWLRLCVFGIGCILWIVLFAVIIDHYGLPADIGGYGAPVRLSCVNNLWWVYLNQKSRIEIHSDCSIIGPRHSPVDPTAVIASLLPIPPSLSTVLQDVSVQRS